MGEYTRVICNAKSLLCMISKMFTKADRIITVNVLFLEYEQRIQNMMMMMII